MSVNVILGVLKKTQIKGYKHENDSDVHHQSFPQVLIYIFRSHRP
jgi:hypothetical protein